LATRSSLADDGVVNPHGERTTLAYDAAGRQFRTVHGNSSLTTYAYDDANRTTAVVHRKSGGALVQATTYTYDNVGTRLSAAESVEWPEVEPFQANPGGVPERATRAVVGQSSVVLAVSDAVEQACRGNVRPGPLSLRFVESPVEIDHRIPLCAVRAWKTLAHVHGRDGCRDGRGTSQRVLQRPACPGRLSTERARRRWSSATLFYEFEQKRATSSDRLSSPEKHLRG
jgi:hypothetical protein